MNPIEKCEKLISIAWKLFEETPVGLESLEALSELRSRLYKPCELAIAGKVKAGKSSFLNVLIGEDLAKVGDLETTATINRFCFGIPKYKNRPVRVVWDDGHESFEALEFMDNLQGHDESTLNIAAKIAYLEYMIDNPLLKELTIVDTPGTGAVVETHQEVAEKYFKLREKHKDQTKSCTSRADAVVYLMGAAPNIRDKAFLEDFKKSTEDGMPLNAIGVLSKVDIDTQLIADRHNQAQYLSDSLKEHLSIVVPVSSAMAKAVKEKNHLFEEWRRMLKQIPRETMDKMLKNAKLFVLPSYSDLPVDVRMKMKEGMPWSIFRTIAHELYNSESVEDAIARLDDIANIERVKTVINDYFFKRSKLIRCSRVLSDLLKLCMQVSTQGVFQLRQKKFKFESWIRQLQPYKVSNVSEEMSALTDYLKSNYKDENAIRAYEESLLCQLKAPIENLLGDIRQADIDFQTLSLLKSNRDSFSEEEYDELTKLFGMYAGISDDKNISYDNRLEYWTGEIYFTLSETKRQIIHHAIKKYSQF